MTAVPTQTDLELKLEGVGSKLSKFALTLDKLESLQLNDPSAASICKQAFEAILPVKRVEELGDHYEVELVSDGETFTFSTTTSDGIQVELLFNHTDYSMFRANPQLGLGFVERVSTSLLRDQYADDRVSISTSHIMDVEGQIKSQLEGIEVQGVGYNKLAVYARETPTPAATFNKIYFRISAIDPGFEWYLRESENPSHYTRIRGLCNRLFCRFTGFLVLSFPAFEKARGITVEGCITDNDGHIWLLRKMRDRYHLLGDTD